MLALDGTTGEIVWEVPRACPTPGPRRSWSRTRGNRVITCGDPWVIAYDPADGSEIWRAKCLKGDVGPSPVFADGIVYVANEGPMPWPSATAGRGT